MSNTIHAINKSFENKDGKGYLYDGSGKLLAVFDGDICESNSLLYVVQNGKMYYIILNEDGKYCLEKY